MKTVCAKDNCAGCRACMNICPRDAIQMEDSLDSYNAVIQEDICIDCGTCYRVCPNVTPVECNRPIRWYQGWAENAKEREIGSSGGVASAISSQFIRDGGMVCGCKLTDGKFIFELTDDEKSIHQFSGSKYVKSDPLNVYRLVKTELEENRRVLFIGLPCQVAALKNIVGVKLEKNLYTIDLICHGTPSPKLLDVFLDQYNCKLKNFKNISFRKKAKFQIYGDEEAIGISGTCDYYSIAFLSGMSFTENCYDCQYSKLERVSDITLGDSWGSGEPLEEVKKGISLILCQTDKGLEVLGKTELHLASVNIENAIAHNCNLREPSTRPKKREFFFKLVKRGERFNKIIRMCYPWTCFKQFVKGILIKCKAVK